MKNKDQEHQFISFKKWFNKQLKKEFSEIKRICKFSISGIIINCVRTEGTQ